MRDQDPIIRQQDRLQTFVLLFHPYGETYSVIMWLDSLFGGKDLKDDLAHLPL